MNDRSKSTQDAINAIENALLTSSSNLAERTISSTDTLNSLKIFGIDSLGMFQVICEVEQLLGISIPDAALQVEEITIAEWAQRIHELGCRESEKMPQPQ